MMTPIRTALVFVFLLVGLAEAQSTADISLKLQRKGFDQYPTAIEDFSIVGTAFADDSAIASDISKIIRDDLSFHIAFRLIEMDSLLLQVLELPRMTDPAWKHLGAEYLVKGEFTSAYPNVHVKYTMLDLGRSIEIKTDGLQTPRDNYRSLAHLIADDVVRLVAGMKPIFNTKMAFISSKSGNKEVYMCDYDGARISALTANKSINLSPVWDAGGESIFYTSFKGGSPELWRVDVASNKHTRVVSYPGINASPTISPDNDEICMTLTKDDNAELYLLDINGVMKRRLTYTSAIESSPSFGPNGFLIAFSSDRTGFPQVYLMDRDGLNPIRVTYNSRYNDSPAISPDGSKIVFVARGEDGQFGICVVDISGENFRVITDGGSSENPHWAPDGYHIVYSSRHGNATDLFIADFLGIHNRRITSDGVSTNPYWGPYPR
jgi:TolB protein